MGTLLEWRSKSRSRSTATTRTLAAWWADTLGWIVEPQDPDFIRRMVTAGHASEDDTMELEGSLVWRTGAAIRSPDGDAGSPRILFQLVPEEKTTKNRAHLDIRGAGDDVSALSSRLLERGATFVQEGRQGPYETWIVMTDPQGNEFCV